MIPEPREDPTEFCRGMRSGLHGALFGTLSVGLVAGGCALPSAPSTGRTAGLAVTITALSFAVLLLVALLILDAWERSRRDT